MPLNSSSNSNSGEPNRNPDNVPQQAYQRAQETPDDQARNFPQPPPRTQTQPPNQAPPLRSQGEFYMTGVIPIDLFASLLPLDAECTICLEPLTSDVVEMQVCKHHFHTNGILSWLENNAPRNGTKRSNCPNCRRDFYEPDPRPCISSTTYDPTGRHALNVLGRIENGRERQEQIRAVDQHALAEPSERQQHAREVLRMRIRQQFSARRAHEAREARAEVGDWNLVSSTAEAASTRLVSVQFPGHITTPRLPPPLIENIAYNRERRNAIVPGQYEHQSRERMATERLRMSVFETHPTRRSPDVILQHHIPTGAPYGPRYSTPTGYIQVRQELEQLLERSGLTADRLIAVWRRQCPLTNDASYTVQGDPAQTLGPTHGLNAEEQKFLKTFTTSTVHTVFMNLYYKTFAAERPGGMATFKNYQLP